MNFEILKTISKGLAFQIGFSPFFFGADGLYPTGSMALLTSQLDLASSDIWIVWTSKSGFSGDDYLMLFVLKYCLFSLRMSKILSVG